ncbi:MAG TPA: tRNA uridine-5-carboxymethylaminomethyl(34) synthesis GTPase MnmE [Casimicrobiaceae bacterium]
MTIRSLAPVIAAIATPPGRGGIGIIRVSGPALDHVIDGIVGKPLAPRLATQTIFLDAHGTALDVGLALFFPAPHSFTGETVLELHGHGSPAALRLVLARCLELGARIAEPGEFTKRAFLNGKVDLAQAEAVADLIDAATSTAARAAIKSLTGEFSRNVQAIVAAVTELRMYTEAALDFPDEDVDFLRAHDAFGRMQAIRELLEQLLSRSQSGALLREGLSVVLIGRPNVGKSSLLNRLVREDAAIVTSIAGTTRDTVERSVELAGIPLTVIDTAGLRETNDEVERLGIERTWAAVERSDLALLIVDARDVVDTLDPADAALLARLPRSLPRIVIHNKGDLASIAPHVEMRVVEKIPRCHIWLSALTGAGTELLEHEVLAMFSAQGTAEDAFLARERHLVALKGAGRHLGIAAFHIAEKSPPLELFAEELREAQNALGSITGEVTADDLLGVIFSRFCIGK